MTRSRLPHLALVALAAVLVGALAATGCARSQPAKAGRAVLGTAVEVTVYGDEAKVRNAQDAAFAAMSAVEAQLDPYDATSSIRAVNDHPFSRRPMPKDGSLVYEAILRLGVADEFSPDLLGVTRLYDFGGEGRVPTDAELARAVELTHRWLGGPGWVRFFASPDATPPPGFDFGGAAKGLALDRAAAVLDRRPGVTGYLMTTVSSTVASGTKGDGEPWRIGVEDPREPGRVIATIESEPGPMLNVSTSGDYQLFFERDGVRYHHILDPATGKPARGTRSLTVFGRMSGLDADILSTALFVMGPTRALAYAKEHGIGVLIVDAKGGEERYEPPVKGLRLLLKESPRR